MIYLPNSASGQEYLVKKNLERILKKIQAMPEEKRKEAERQILAERERINTKPEAIVETVNGRPIVVVGAGQHWDEDLRDVARRRGEREMFDKGRKFTPLHPMETMKIALDKYNRQSVGLTVHHIKNNPISNREI